jgi:tetratricopeptide (TPR) repeat protein/predicted Ser/Thr protein kinase
LVAKVECPGCGEPVPGDAEHCPECGVELHAGEDTIFLAGDDPGTVVLGPDGKPSSADDWPTDQLPAVEEPHPEGPVAAQPGLLDPGSVLGERYRISKRLGLGGMGAVYKARDLELERDVALKVIRPELETDEEALQRFKQEIILARGITHRNVVRIFDLGQAGGIKFISMEFIEGKDLTELIRESGPLSVDDAAVIVEQICMALDTAHQEGVVHRDLKPQNVMIDADERVVVMDFGIARSLQSSSMTQTGALLGTPDYMSPEQVKGEQADARTDIFALGIIFYELLTGKLPYSGDTPMATMFKRTQDKATPVRDRNPELPPYVSDIIHRCLEMQPHKRYQSAREILQDLAAWRGGTVHPTIGPTIRGVVRPTTTRARTRMKIGVIAGAALAVMALVVAAVAFWPRGEPATRGETAAAAPAPTADAMSLAILPFRNATGDSSLDWLTDGLAEMLRTDIGQSAMLRSVSSDRLHQILRDLRLRPGDSMEEVTLRRIAEFGNAETLVWGQFVKLGDQIRIDATVRDFERHQTTTLKAEAASEQDLLGAVAKLAEDVRGNLALSRAGRRELERQAFMPSSQSVAALRHYNEGLALVREGNNLDAVARFESSIESDPDFALAHSRLALSYLSLGRGQRAEEASRRAVELSGELPDAERFLILAENARIAGDYEQGIDAYSNLLRMHPNDPELHAALALLYEDEGSFDEARGHLDTALAADPRNLNAQLSLGRVLIKSGEVQESLAPLNQALSLAIQTDNAEAKANTLQALGIGYRRLGQVDEALDNFQESLAIKREIGDRRGTASSLSEIANLQELSGDPDAARTSYQEAIEISREIGDDYGVGRRLLNLGDLETTEGNYDEALGLTREALRIQMEIGDELNQARSLNNVGTIYDQKGEYSESLVYYQQALDLRERLGNPYDIADTLHNMAETYTAMGRYQQAQDHYLRALEQRRAAADEIGAAYELYSLGKVFEYQSRYGAALGSMEEALQIFRRLEETGGWYIESLAGYGNALSLLGRFDEARPVLDEALQLARDSGDGMLEVVVLNYLGDSFFYAGDPAAARAPYTEALEAADATQDPILIVGTQANLARLAVMEGRPREALAAIDESISEAQGRGMRYLATRCTVCRARALASTGDPSRAIEEARDALRTAEDLDSLALIAQSHHLLAGLLRDQGDAEDAARHESKAAEYLQQMRDEAGSDALLNRADLEPIAESAGPAAE